MNKEIRSRIYGKFECLAQEKGTKDQQRDMWWQTLANSHYINELADIKAGIKNPNKSPQHPVSVLRERVLDSWIKMRKLAKEIESSAPITAGKSSSHKAKVKVEV